jgi:GR25 family glycosyltransferase involved in LPS biosynthesis
MDVPILYINLDRSLSRNSKMIESLGKISNNYERISGFDSQNIDKNAQKEGEWDGMKYTIKPHKKYNPRAKEIAIILSHMKALKKIIDNNYEMAIIMEDDLSFQYIEDWNKKINNIIANAPSNWKILKFHNSFSPEVRNNISLCERGIHYTPLTKDLLHSAGCYIIKKSAVLELMDKYNIDGIYTFPKNNEFCVCECIVFSLSNVYVYTVPYICVNDENVSTNGKRNPLDTNTNLIIHSYWKKKNPNIIQQEKAKKTINNNYKKPNFMLLNEKIQRKKMQNPKK